jgi:hypothetical protein
MPPFTIRPLTEHTGSEVSPWAMRPSLSQVCRATTGQVVSLEPRPISTSRHPVLPRTRMRSPWSKNSIQPAQSAVSSGPQSSPVSLGRERAGVG